jgi:List-Bact-rpt repeat protein
MRKLTRRSLLGALCAALMTLGVGAAPAQGAFSDPLFVFIPSPPPPPAPVTPPPTGYLNGPCGLAVNSSGQIHVSDYYHHVIDVFTAGSSQASLPSYVSQIANVDPLDGPCGLALDASNNLYVNDYHRDVMKSPPSGTIFNSDHPTGVAVDATGNVYVNNRTYVSVYDSGGSLLYRLGEGTLRDGYGLAVSQFAGTFGYVYVPDTFTNTVKVYDPLTDRVNPKAEIRDPFGRPFVSLQDSAAAVDRVTGEVYFADNTQPRYTERPQSTIYVYSSTNSYRGHLKYNVADALPPGLAVDNTAGATQGRVYVTSGNTHQAGVYAYPPGAATMATPLPPTAGLALSASGSGGGSITSDLAGIECDASCEAQIRSGAEVTLAATPDEDSVFAGWSGGGCSGTGDCTVEMSEARSVSAEFEALAGPPAPAQASSGAAASAAPLATASEIDQEGTLRVTVTGKLSPKRLPRTRVAPIAVSVGGAISTTDASLPPQLKTLRIELNRHGKLDYAGLPTCVYNRIQPGSSSRALSACRSSLVGRGSFTANITLAGQEPYPTRGRLLVFNGLRGRKPVLYGHIYSASPFATSFVIVFSVQRLGGGTYGTALNAPLPKAMDAWGRLTGLEMTLSRRYNYLGRRRSYISSGCPAPRGFPGAVFPLARASFTFDGGTKLSSVFTSTCKVRG